MTHERNLAAKQLFVEIVEGGLLQNEIEELVYIIGNNDYAKQEKIALDGNVDVLLGEKLEYQVQGEQEERTDNRKHVCVFGRHALHALNMMIFAR